MLGDAVAVERFLLLQGGDDAFAGDRLFGAVVVQEDVIFQLGLVAFAFYLAFILMSVLGFRQ